MALIDLGVPGDGSEDYEPPPRPRRSAYHRRIVLAAALALVVLGTCAAAATPAKPPFGLREVAELDLPVISEALPGENYLLDGDSMFVTEMAGGSVSIRRLALDAGGREAWRIPVPGGYSLPWLVVRNGLLLVVDMGVSVTSGPQRPPMRTLAYDIGTGTQVWSHPGSPRWDLVPGELIMTDYQEDTERVISVDPRTGADRWMYPSGKDESVSVVRGADGAPAVPTRLLSLRRTPTTAVLSLVEATTGVRSAGLDLPELRLPAEDPRSAPQEYQKTPQLMLAPVAGGVTWILDRVLSMYDLQLRRRWTRALPADTRYAESCGALLCVLGNGGTQVLDPATGEVLWSRPGLTPYLAGFVMPLGEEFEPVVLDPRDGHELLRFGEWRFARFMPGDRGDRYDVLVRRLRPTPDDRWRWLGILDRARARIYPVRVPATYLGECNGSDRYLVCAGSTPQQVKVWAYERA